MTTEGLKHTKTVIREFVVNLLKGKTLAGQKVFPQRALDIQQVEEIPCITVYIQSGRSSRSGDGSNWDRQHSLLIQGALLGNEKTIDEEIETFQLQVETAMKSDLFLGNYVTKEIELVRDDCDIAEGGDYYVAGFELEYSINWIDQLEDEPDGVLPNEVFTSPDPVETNINFDPVDNGIRIPVNLCGPDGCDLPFDGGEYPRT
jgi:hypothetical protein